MGTQFFWFYDIVLVALVVAVIYKCARKGLIASLLGLVSIVVAFLVAFSVSEVATNYIYDHLVSQTLKDELNTQLSNVLTDTVITDVQKVDMSKATINGKTIAELELKPDSTGQVIIDLTKVDLSKTGIADANLAQLGLPPDSDFGNIKAGMLQLTTSEIKNNDVGDLILAQTIAAASTTSPLFDTIMGAADSLGGAFPKALDGFVNSIKAGDNETIAKIMLSVINLTNGTASDAILNNFVKPVIIVPIRALIFFLLFAIIGIILAVIINITKVINKLPVIGKFNAFLGAVLGVGEAVIVLFVVCIALQILISMTNNTLIFLNTETIDKTFLFKYVFNYGFLNFE